MIFPAVTNYLQKSPGGS